MRGGALPPFAWALLLAVLGTLNLIWTGDAIETGTFGFAVLAILSLGTALALRSPDARRTGPPEPPGPPGPEPAEAVPAASLAAVIAALGLASIGLGLTFGKFPILFGAALILAALARLAVELRAQRRTRERVEGRR